MSIILFILAVCDINSHVDYSIWNKFKELLVEVYIFVAFNFLYNMSSSKKSNWGTSKGYNTKVCYAINNAT